MLSKKEFLKEEKDCAEMLGMTIKEYRNNLKNSKVTIKHDKKINMIIPFYLN